MTVRVRAADVDDAEAIARIHVRSWQVGYRGLMPDKVLDGLDPVDWGERRRAHLARRRPDQGVFVAVDERDVIVGFTMASEGEVHAIYVDPDAWGTGAGRALLDAAVSYLTGAGRLPVRLWVLDSKERARRFYERYGFVADGAVGSHPVAPGLEVPTVRYTLAPADR
jgi:GNAT superfamily N-acetyltransferase